MKKFRPSIQQLLEEKLHLKRAQVYKRAKETADTLSISTKDGMLVLAARQRVNLHKHGLPETKVEQIRELLGTMPPPARAGSREPTSVNTGKTRAARPKKAFRVKLQKSETDPMLSSATLNDLRAMTEVYQTLYHLENSIRVFIARVLKAKHGPDWWNIVAPNKLKTDVTDRTQDDEINAWHQRRSANPIDYLDLNRLPNLVRAAQADFVPSYFSSIEWFQGLIDEVYRSRCVVCHMNPLNQTNVDAVGVRFNHWQTLMKAKLSELEKLEAQPTAALQPNPPAASVSLGTTLAAPGSQPLSN